MNSYFYNNMNMFHPTLMRNQYPLHLQYLYPYSDPYMSSNQPKPLPFQPQENDLTYKNQIIKWMNTLTAQELSTVFTIRNQETVYTIIKMFAHETLRTPSLYAKKENVKQPMELSSNLETIFMVRHRNEPVRQEHTTFLNYIQVLGNFEAITLQQQVFQKDLTQLFEVMDQITDGKIFSVQPRVYQNRKNYSVEDALWFNSSSFQSFTNWLGNAFEKEIALAYYKSKKRSDQLEEENSLQELKIFWISCERQQRTKVYLFLIITNSQIQNQGLKEVKQDKEKKHEETQWLSFLQTFNSETLVDQKFRSYCEEKGDGLIDYMVSSTLIEMSRVIHQFIIVNPITCFVKRLYKIVAQQYREKLEKDLIQTEESEKKQKSAGKLKKKKKSKPKDKSKLLCLTESDNESKSFQTKNCICQTTPPNSLLETPESKKSFFSFEEVELQTERANQAIFLIQFEGNHMYKDNTSLAEQMASQLIQISMQCVHEKEEYEQQMIAEKKKQKKKIKRQEKLAKEKEEKKQLVQNLQEEENKVVNSQKDDVAAKSHCTGSTTATTSEEEFKKIHCFQTKKKKFSEIEKKKQFQQNRKLAKNQKNQLTQTTYRSYCIKSDSSLRLARSNNFPRKQENIVIESNKEEVSVGVENVIIIEEKFKEQEDIVEETKDDMEVSDYQDGSKQDIDTKLWYEAEQKMVEKLSKDAMEFTEDVLNDCEKLLVFRELIYLRILHLVKHVFKNVQIDMRLFGSCSTGLALPSSDIDTFILGFEYTPRQQLSVPMSLLVSKLQRTPWVVRQESILTSSIPLVKLEVDPRVMDEESQINLSEKDLSYLNSSGMKLEFKVDITFICHPEHLGYWSTEQIKDWREKYRHLQAVVIIMKSVVKELGLNEAYRGGLSSYSIIIMVLAFLKDYGDEECLGRVLVEMCNFYGNKFSPREQAIGVSYTSESSFVSLEQYNLSVLPISIISPLSNKVISSSCTQAAKILEEIRTIYSNMQALTKYFYDFLMMKEKKKRVRKNQAESFNNRTKDNFIAAQLRRIKSNQT